MQSKAATLVWQYKISALERDFPIVYNSRNGFSDRIHWLAAKMDLKYWKR